MSGHVTAIKIAGTGTVSVATNDVASIDIPSNGEIIAVMGYVTVSGFDALDDKGYAELSFLSTNQIAVNDARGSILEVTVRQSFLTSGGGNGSQMVTMTFPSGYGIPVNGGERIHLHTQGSTGNTPTAAFMIYLSEGGSRRAPRRR